MTIRRWIVLAMLVAAMPVGRPAAAPAEMPIQPGAIIFTRGQCTMNFVFRDAQERLYIGTAGHCTRLGDRVSATGPDGTFEFGTVVYHERAGSDDFALIRIDPEHYDQVSPAVRVWGGPTGVTRAVETAIGDVVMLHGFGMVFRGSALTRPRQGVLSNDSTAEYRAYLPALFGDSGGPVLHGPSGAALGTANEIGLATSTLKGPTFEGILARMAFEGIHVEIVTAPYTPPL